MNTPGQSTVAATLDAIDAAEFLRYRLSVADEFAGARTYRFPGQAARAKWFRVRRIHCAYARTRRARRSGRR